MFTDMEMQEFRQRTRISDRHLETWSEAKKITSLRDIRRIIDLRVMPMQYLEQLLRNVTLAGAPNIHPYAEASIETVRMDPVSLLVPQTFIERAKYQGFLEGFQNIFKGFCVTRGVAKCTALIVFGETADGELAIAHYLPPIIEDHGRLHLIDGMHRNFLVMTIGTTLETIVIRGVSVPFPCTPQGWSAVKVVSEKPPKEERFFNLKPGLFRDLKWVGIDG